VAGVIFALLALAVIGLAGYVWLNPDLGWLEIKARYLGKAAPATTDAVAVDPEAAAEVGSTDSAQVSTLDRSATSCQECGMFTDQTLGQIQAVWSDGSSTWHDCWTCLARYGKGQGLTLASATVLDYAAGLEARHTVDAAAAHYLYDVSELEGSMRPYVAAFADEASAQAAQASLGGELLDFAGLQARLEKELSGE
jgi:hypothetical protein